MIVPYTERVKVSFETDKEMPELRRGFKMAKSGNWNAAIAYYNLGLCYTYADQFDMALTVLEEAYFRNPVNKYQKAIDELNVRIEDKRRLKEQGVVNPLNHRSVETEHMPG